MPRPHLTCGSTRGRNIPLTALLIALVAGAASPARAAKIIGLKFGNGAASTIMNPDPGGDIAGAPGVRTTNWNSVAISGNNGTTSLNPTDNTGNLLSNPANGGSATAATVFTGQLTGNPGGGSGANDAKLYGSIWDKDERNAEGSVTITDLPWTNYLIFCYSRPDQGGGGARGGYWWVRDTGTNTTSITMETYTTNEFDLTITTNIVTTNLFHVFTNYSSARWLKGQDAPSGQSATVPTPDANGNNYMRSFTSVQPSTWAQVQQGNYVVLPGNPNPVRTVYTTNIDLTATPPTTNVTSTTDYVTTIYFTAVGGGANGVTGGDSARRHKVAGLQIVALPSANLTNIVLQSAIPNLLAGNSTPTAFLPIGQYNDGDTFSLALLPSGVSYQSLDTNVFTVNASAQIFPRHAGTANLVIASGSISATQTVTVLAPTAIRLSLNPTNLFIGNNSADSVQAQVFADFAGASTNAAVSNLNVTAFNFVTFTGSPANLISVTPGGLVTAIGTGGNNLFSLQATFESLVANLNAGGHVQLFPAPGSLSSFGVDITDAVPANQANFKDLTGAPGARQAYWNNLVYNSLSTTSPSNAVINVKDYHGDVLTNTTAVWTSQGFGGVSTALTTNEYKVLHYAFDAGANGSGAPGTTTGLERTVVISNLPYSSYDAYFYFWNDSGNASRIGHVTAMETLETRWRANVATLPNSLDNIAPNPATGAGYLQAVPIISGGSIPNGVYPPGLSDVPGGIYIKFTGLTNPIAAFRWGPDGSDIVPGANNTMRLRMSAFQIVRNVSSLATTNVYLDAVSSNALNGLLPGNWVSTALTAFADFTDGTKGADVTALSTFSSSDTNVFFVDTNGVVIPGQTPGTANLVINFKTASYTQDVTTLAPTSVTIKAKPGVSYVDAGAQPGALVMLARFPGQGDVDVSLFNGVTFYDASTASAAVAYVSGPPWTISPLTVGTADLAGSYLGMGRTNVAGFQVRNAYDNGSPVNVLTDSANPADPASNSNLRHRYTFSELPGDAIIVDSVGGANGVISPGLSGSSPLVLDGSRVNFPSNNVYRTTPYITLPSGIISELGDVTIDIWCGMNEQKPWARFFDFGSSAKGTDGHNDGNGITSLFFTGIPGGAASPRFSQTFPGGSANVDAAGAMPLGTEQHFTLVYSPNQSVTKMYLNGVLVNAGATVGALQTLNDQNVWIGQSQWQDPILNGWISELRIYEGAFTDADAAASEAAGPNVGIIAVPSIAVSRTGSNLVLSWPVEAGDFVLKSNVVLNGTWYDVGATLTTNGGHIEATVPANSGNAFFLLKKP